MNMENINKSQGCFWIPLFGIISAVFLFFAIAFNGGGHGPLVQVIIVASPLVALALLLDQGLVFFLVPFYWMGEAALALSRNARCGWAFLFAVPARYIFTIIFMFSCDDSFHRFSGDFFDILIFPGSVAILYIGVQILLWALYLRTWEVWEWPKRR